MLGSNRQWKGTTVCMHTADEKSREPWRCHPASPGGEFKASRDVVERLLGTRGLIRGIINMLICGRKPVSRDWVTHLDHQPVRPYYS